MWACDALERSLNEFEGTLLFVSHDRYFLNRVADHLLVVEGDRFRVIEGNYDTYLYAQRSATAETSAEKSERKEEKALAAKKSGREKPARPKRKFPYRKVPDLEAEIFQRESRLEELQTAMNTPEVLRDGRRVKQLQAEITEQQALLRTLYEHWEEASELN